MLNHDFNRFRNKIILATLFFSLIPLLVLGWLIYDKFSSSYASKIYDNIKVMVESRRQTIDLFLEERVSQLMSLAYSNTFDRITDTKYLENLFNYIQGRSKHYVDIGVIDENGNHVAYVGPFRLLGVNYREAEWFKKVMSKGWYISDVFLGIRGVPHFIIAVSRPEMGKTWILRATIDSDIFENLVKKVHLGKSGDAYLVNKQGVLQTTPRFQGALFEKKEDLDIESFLNTGVSLKEVREKGLIRVGTWLNTKDWLFVIEQDPTSEMDPLFKTKQLTLIIGLLGCVFIVAGAFLVSHFMVQELERQAKEKAVLDANIIQSSKLAALGKLAAGIAHEINNPLSVILEKAGWIKDLLEEEDIKASKNFQEFLSSVEKIEEHVDRARKVTHRLLGFVRKMEPADEPVNLKDLISDTVSFLESEASFKDVAFITSYAQDLKTIRSDKSQLQQVFLNILENALDAVDQGGKVWIEAGMDGDNLVFVNIKDNGPGIPDSLKKKIFEPFFTTKPTGSGTGLGLSIAYSILQRLGGSIEVLDNNPKGAIFKITLPIRRPDL